MCAEGPQINAAPTRRTRIRPNPIESLATDDSVHFGSVMIMASTPAFFENSTFLVKTTSFVNQILARRILISRNGASVCAAATADDVVQADAGADTGGGQAVWAHAVEVVILVQGNEEKILAQDAAISGAANVIEILIGIAPGI